MFIVQKCPQLPARFFANLCSAALSSSSTDFGSSKNLGLTRDERVCIGDITRSFKDVLKLT